MKQKVKHSKLLVIDACVARSAGETEHPVSSACRECLRDVLEICHHVAVTKKIHEEWGKHQSGFTRKWRRSMAAHRKPLKIGNVTPVPSGLDLEAFSPKDRAAVEKDLHLVEAAFGADKVIVTLDDALQKALGGTPKGRGLRGRLVWYNPVKDKDSPL